MGPNQKKPTIIITRPANTAVRLNDMLVEAGFSVLHEPMFTVEYFTEARLPSTLQKYQAILLTSANAVMALAATSIPRSIPVITVGNYTQDEAILVGFTHVSSADGDAEDLITYVKKNLNPGDGPLLYLSGEVISKDILTPLRQAGFDAERYILYRTKPTPNLSQTFLDVYIQQPFGGIVFYSKKTVEIFLHLYAEHALSEHQAMHWDVFAASAATAERLQPLPWHTVHASHKASTHLMVEQINRYYLSAQGK